MLKKAVKKIIKALVYALPLRNCIIFESAPVYADNTRAVYDEMVRRGLHKKYKFLWITSPNIQKPEKVEHASFLEMPGRSRLGNMWLQYQLRTAKALISCNQVLATGREGQYAICLMHGTLIKDVKGKYQIPDQIGEVLSMSSYLSPIEADRFCVEPSKIRVLGYPRNDTLLDEKLDVHKLFSNVNFDKLVYWMPTFRQHKNGTRDASSISMPILYNEEIAQKINDAAREARVLVVAKPHFAQDVSRITTMALSNLVFINDAFLCDHGIINYELLAAADALLTDYSSVYYDYMLVDRPIGLCWDDYEDYEQREGFAVDMDTVMAGGEKIYTADDLCGFLSRLGKGEDALQAQRQRVLQLIHDYPDANATQRVVDHILKIIEK